MTTSPLGFGIVGTGMIAGVIARAIEQSTKARLAAVSSRQLENAQRFTAERPAVAAVEGLEALLTRGDVEAVYIATPTIAKEAIALAAIAAGKHVLIDKPLPSLASAERLAAAARGRGLALMDATHFVHHPRTAAIRAASPAKIGTPRSLHTTFYFPFSDRANIRFNPRQEPMTALGDMAWYSLRAVVEYLRPQGEIARVAVTTERDPGTRAIVRASGLLAFASGETSTFDVGYTAGTIAMDLQLLGTPARGLSPFSESADFGELSRTENKGTVPLSAAAGIIEMDDFVLDWTNSFAFQNPTIPAGYYHRTGMATRADRTFIATPSAVGQEILMIDTFADLTAPGTTARRADFIAATLQTQRYLDAVWEAANG